MIKKAIPIFRRGSKNQQDPTCTFGPGIVGKKCKLFSIDYCVLYPFTIFYEKMGVFRVRSNQPAIAIDWFIHVEDGSHPTGHFYSN